MYDFPLLNPNVVSFDKALSAVQKSIYKKEGAQKLLKLQKIAPKITNVAPALYFNEGDGAGGEIGGTPDLVNLMMLNQNAAIPDILKELNFYYPKCLKTGLPMQYLGFFTGVNIPIIAKMFQKKIDYFEFCHFGETRTFDSSVPNVKLHVWCSDQMFYDNTQDVVFRLEQVYSKPYKVDMNLYNDAISEYLKDVSNNVEKYVNFPKMLLGESTIEWEIDRETQTLTDNQSDKYYDLRTDYTFKLLGSPKSQQEPHRPLVQGRRPFVRCMAPLLSWNDNEDDMTHQAYCDILALSQVKIAEAKLDSSNT